jgi:hypothetical protein
MNSNSLGRVAFFLALAFLVYLAGILTVRYHLPPYAQINDAIAQIKETLDYKEKNLPWQFFRDTSAPADKMVTRDAARVAPGATMISGFTTDEKIHAVDVISPDNRVIQSWRLDWDSLWQGPADHIPADVMARPQKHIHGAKIAPNGDLIFNFTELAMFRVNACGGLVWRLDKRTHHSIDIAGDGSIWVPGVISHDKGDPDLPNYGPKFEEFTLLHVSPDGKVLKEISINKLLEREGYSGLLYLSTLNEHAPIVDGDTLHMNDAEVFPITMTPGYFRPGDVLISLRNINTLLVIDPVSEKIRFISTGRVMRQHDGDFVDGNTISAFDNNNLLDDWLDNASGKRGTQGQRSDVTVISAPSGRVVSRFDGGGEPFFTDLMGQQQRLANGNLLVTEARAGRLIEFAPDGQVVWEYSNVIDGDLLGAISEAERLPEAMDESFFAKARQACGG